MRKMKNIKVVSIRIPTRDWEELEKITEEKATQHVAVEIRQAIKRYIEEYKKGKK